ncbi:hypothetical protein [Rhizobium sp. PL01]|uniref:hypothetical protein n=1 Tax=Rhizobium sp. PL01 TaxID=3085631 RepID=UPI002982A2F0|nr:hypothetical protein [Rhizobium sp. PL01]MDW5318401.1 hypothetical protein [Rhizobium sp. PL01]
MDVLLLEFPRAGYRPRNLPFDVAEPAVTHPTKHEFVIDGVAWLDNISAAA